MTALAAIEDPRRGARPPPAGTARLRFRRSGERTVLERALATSPLRLLAPRNHGHAAWVFLANFGGGLVDGDRLNVHVEVAEGAAALLGTQASTKVYRSPRGCGQRLDASVAAGAMLVVLPDPVVCFAGARYTQAVEIALAAGASLFLLDGYTCGRRARGERWAFDAYASRTMIGREGAAATLVDATRLDARSGSIAARMGGYDAILCAIAVGPRFVSVREAMLRPRPAPEPGSACVAASSQVGPDGAILRVAAHRFETASAALRPCFQQLARALGDDPIVRKW